MESSDEDFIAGTPEKVFTAPKKIPKSSRDETKLAKPKGKNWYKKHFEPTKSMFSNMEEFRVKDSLAGVQKYNKPYVYYKIEEVANLSEKSELNNDYLHLVGLHKFCTSSGHYLINCRDDNTSSIRLDFKLVDKIPDENQYISVYGTVSFEECTGKRTPLVFIIHFYRCEEEVFVATYKENLEFVRNLIPTSWR